jgi:outer membrane lipoprotein SlyB
MYDSFMKKFLWSLGMKASSLLVSLAVFSMTFLSSNALLAQKSGQSIQIQYGIVVASRYVEEKSNAGKGALVGGAIGLYSGKGKSSGTKFRRTAAGAVVGGAVAAGAQGSREAREYQVKTASGAIVIISDQTEIQVDDCVIVENPGGKNANIRRVAYTYCDPASAEVVAELQDEMLEEAQECVAAKEELSSAATDDAVDRALRKISILCDT